jgi:hypothetical protein
MDKISNQSTLKTTSGNKNIKGPVLKGLNKQFKSINGNKGDIVDLKNGKDTPKVETKTYDESGKLLGKQSGSASVDLPTPPIPKIPTPDIPALDTKKLDQVDKDKIAEKKLKTELERSAKQSLKIDKNLGKKVLRKPALYFVSGLDLFTNGDSGLERISKHVKGSEHFQWNQTVEMLDKIKRTDTRYPVILIGHSLGADSIVDIARELNNIENNFRQIDLLVTIDSVGFDNDIIPQNVKKNMHYFGDGQSFLNDGPNVARDHMKTEVVNILNDSDHVDIDDQVGIQYDILSQVNQVIRSKNLPR